MRGMQIKTSDIPCTLTEMAKIKKINIPSVGKDVKELNLYTAGVNIK